MTTIADAVKRVLDDGELQTVVARDIGVTESKLRRAVKKERDRRGADHPWPRLDLLALDPLPVVEAPKAEAPRGWEEGVKFSAGGKEGILTVSSVGEAPGEGAARDYLASVGWDPTKFDFNPVEVTTREVDLQAAWVRHAQGEDAVTERVKNTTFFARFKLTPATGRASWDIDELFAGVPPCVAIDPPVSDMFGETFLVMLADWQFGKRDQGGATALIERLKALPAAIGARVRELQRMGRNIECILLAGLGDWVEGCVGFYPQQLFSVELDRRQQIRGCMRALAMIVAEVATLGVRVVVTGVAGNHAENRGAGGNKGGMTSTGDNDDLLVLEIVAEMFASREGYEHVSFVVPDQELFHTLDLSGQHAVLTHGHVTSGGQKGLWTWFKNMRAHNHTSATLLLCGHYHHLFFEQDGILAILQATALEGGSDYFTERYGSVTTPGTTTALVSGPAGVRDLAVL